MKAAIEMCLNDGVMTYKGADGLHRNAADHTLHTCQIGKMREILDALKPKTGLEIRAGHTFNHFVNRATGRTLCNRTSRTPLAVTTDKYVDCVGCTVAVQRKFAEEK